VIIYLVNLITVPRNAANTAYVANYGSGLHNTLAVSNGMVSTTGLILAFDLIKNILDV
jgi:hypothetical protein